MPALTGQLGRVGIGWVQLGGAPVSATPLPLPGLPTKAVPYIAHVYSNDGVTFQRTLGPLLNAPTLKSSLLAGQDPVLIQVPYQTSGNLFWGQFKWGTRTWGGSVATQGSIIKLTEQGGDGSVVYTGLVEDVQEDLNAQGVVTHTIALAPLIAELGRIQFTATYTSVDPAQWVRDAVRQCQHLGYTQDSIPNTGVPGTYTFSQSTGTDVMTQARLVAGPNYWFWVDERGIVWFRPMASAAAYTARMGVDYSASKKVAPITDLKNYILVQGAVPTGGSAPAKGIYSNTISQKQYGVRQLNPPMVVPTCSDPFTLTAMANTLGGIFDRPLRRVDITLPRFGTRLQPGQQLRLFEPSRTPFPESSGGSGGYTGPYTVLEVTRDGPTQKVGLGDIPFSLTASDYLQLVERVSVRNALAPLTNPSPSLVNMTTLNGGGIQSAPAPMAGTPSPPRWALNNGGMVVYDGTSNNYGAPAGQGVTVEIDSSGAAFFASLLLQSAQQGARMVFDSRNGLITIYDPNGVVRWQEGNLPANGVSPAQWGARANDPNGNPIFDSLGVIGAASLLTSETLARSAMAGSGTGWSNVQTISGSGANFTLSRQGKILCYSYLSVFMNTGQPQNYMALYHAIWTQGGSLVTRKQISAAQPTQGVNSFPVLISTFINLSAGSYQFRQEFALDAATTSCAFGDGATAVFPTAAVIQLGG